MHRTIGQAIIQHPFATRVMSAAAAFACGYFLQGLPYAHASVLDLFGYGARGIALVGAMPAASTGPESVYYNPAALAFDTRLSFSLGFQTSRFGLRVNDEKWDAREAPALTIGFGVPLPFGGALRERLAIGLGFVLPQTSILIADTPRPGEFSYVLLENRAQTVSIQAGLAFRVTDWLSLGYGVLALSELEGAIDVGPNPAGRLGSEARDQLVADYSQVASVSVRPHDRVEGSLSWRQESTADYELPITVDLGDQFQIPVPVLDIGGTAQFDPQQVAVSVSGRPHLQVQTHASVVWKQWSAFRNPIRYTAVPDGYPAQPDPNFSDRVSVRLGVEASFEAGPVMLIPRLGYAWEPTPVPEQTGLHNYLDSNRNVLGIGLGATLGQFSLDIGTQLHLISDRTHSKACVENADGDLIVPLEPGANSQTTYPGPNPGCPGVSNGGTLFLAGAELGVHF